MNDRVFHDSMIDMFHQYLIQEEKSTATIEKYLRDIRAFRVYVGEQPVTKEQTVAFKKSLMENQYAVASINSMLASLNSFFKFAGWHECRTKNIRQQKKLTVHQKKN